MGLGRISKRNRGEHGKQRNSPNKVEESSASTVGLGQTQGSFTDEVSAVRIVRGTWGPTLETFHFQTGLELVHRAMGSREGGSDMMEEVFEKVNLATLCRVEGRGGEERRNGMEGVLQPLLEMMKARTWVMAACQ